MACSIKGSSGIAIDCIESQNPTEDTERSESNQANNQMIASITTCLNGT
jgi:hypothetical protein